jgi:CubicO group peptidase (beta-lactamase class C family)
MPSFQKATEGFEPRQRLNLRIPICGLMILLWACWTVSCVPPTESTGDATDQDEWETAQPKDVELDEKILAELVDRIENEEFQNVHSILIIKEGKLVFEEYFPGYEWDWDADQFQGESIQYDADTIHPIMSVSKVFTSALTGMAIEHGFITGLEEKVFPFFPEYSYLSDIEKENITLEHLITMGSGLQWNGIEIPVSTRDPSNDVFQMHMSSDPIGYVLSKPLAAEPGSKWYYSNGDTALLGEVVKLSTGMGLDQFAEKHLFAPLGIADYLWRTFGDTDVIDGAGGLELRSRDMAKLGYLYLNRGIWNGEQVISEAWVEESTTKISKVPYDWLADSFGEGFGYYWWLRSYQTDSAEHGSFASTGWGGQRIDVFPDLDMVVVMTGGNYLSEDPGTEILEKFILSATE